VVGPPVRAPVGEGSSLNTRDEYQELFDIYWPIGVGVFLVVVALLAFILIRFRSRADDFPRGRDKSTPAELLYAAGLVCIAGLLVFFTFSTMSDLESPPSAAEPPLEIEVTAAKWNWRFDYPEERISEVGTNTQPATLVVPAGRPVRFTLTSLDVIHSFWIPEVRFKRDAFPGRETSFDLIFDEVGVEEGGGECAEFCGLRHAYMDFDLEVKPPDAFEAWVEAGQDVAATEAAPRSARPNEVLR